MVEHLGLDPTQPPGLRHIHPPEYLMREGQAVLELDQNSSSVPLAILLLI